MRMPDREKVIKDLQFALDGCSFTGWSFAQVEKQTVSDALELLNVQKPISPKYDDYGVWCGKCGHGLPGGDQSYCPNCGSEVKWYI